MISHLLFDFFGTLVDYSASRTEQGYERSFALLRDSGCRLDYAGFLTAWSKVSEELDAAAAASHREVSSTLYTHRIRRENTARDGAAGDAAL